MKMSTPVNIPRNITTSTLNIIHQRKYNGFLSSSMEEDYTPVLYVSPSEEEYRLENNKNQVPISPTDFFPPEYKHFTMEGLEKCSLSQLMNICRIYRIRISEHREEMIERILEHNIQNIQSV